MQDIFVAPKKTGDINPKIKKTKKVDLVKSDDLNINAKKVPFLSSFYLNPGGISFKEQEEDEEIVLLLRRHLVTSIPWLCVALVLLFAPIFLSFFSGYFSFLPLVPTAYKIFFLLFYYLCVLMYAFVNFISWFYNVSLVTQKRLVDIHFFDILYHDMAMTKINLIEDITFTQAGFIRSFFNYGDIFIQTAGEKMHFDFSAIPSPERVMEIIENLMGGDNDIHGS